MATALPRPGNFDAADARERLQRDGYHVIAGVVPESFLAELRQASDCLRRSEYLCKLPGARQWPIVKELSGFRTEAASPAPAADIFDTFQVCWVNRSRAVDLLAGTIGMVAQLMAEIAQRSLALSFASLIVKASGAKETPWHQDAAYDPNWPGDLAPLTRLHTWIPLVPVDDTSGCLCYLAGSQRSRLLAHREDAGSDSLVLGVPENALADEVRCAMMPGDLVVHLPTTIHRAAGNDHPDQRAAFNFNYSVLGRRGRI